MTAALLVEPNVEGAAVGAGYLDLPGGAVLEVPIGCPDPQSWVDEYLQSVNRDA